MTETKDLKLQDVVVAANARRHFDEAKMAELTASVKQFDVLEPILVRRVDDHYQLIAGERRLRAARAAGLEKIPARIMDVDEKGAAEIQMLENLHRVDLGPVEEARGLNALLAAGNYTVETLACRVGKSATYVYRAIHLMDLPEAALAAVEDGTLTPAHGHQILRAPAEAREELVAYAVAQARHYLDGFPVRELKDHIERQFGADLGSAVFPKGKAFAGEVACSACPFNSGNQGNLFDGAEKGHCSNPPCYQKKTAHFTDEYSKGCAADYPGIQYLGVHRPDYAGGLEGVKRALVLNADLPRQVAKLVKAQPEKFGWAVVAPRGAGEKMTHALVCLDRKVLEKTDTQQPSRAPAGASYAQQRFVEEEVTKALHQAVAETVEGSRFDFTPAQWRMVQRALMPWPEMEGTTNKALAQQLLVRLAATSECLEDLVLDQDKIAGKAAKAAEKRWGQEQAAKAKAG
jgi:ParB/RepB/Spo0J family partition protein